MHDGGGDRSQTVAALPEVIDRMRAEGFQFVAVSDLLGETRGEVMVPLSHKEWLWARSDWFIFELHTGSGSLSLLSSSREFCSSAAGR